MKKIIKIISNHKWAIIGAILIGFIIAAPQIYFRFEHRDIYWNIGLIGADEPAFLSRIQEVRDGHYRTASYVWLEGKDLPYLIPSLSEIIANSAGQIFNLDIADTVTLNRFIFPALMFIVIYVLAYQLTKRKSAALAIGATVLLSTELVNPRVAFDLIFKGVSYSYHFLPFARLISPQVHLIFFFGFLMVFWLFIENKKKSFKYLSGVILGLSFYTYPYTWTFILAFLGCLFLINIFRKKWPEIKDIITISLIALIISIPYLINLWRALNHPLYVEVSSRFGIVNTHTPQIGAMALILLAIFLLFFSRERKERYYFCLALVLAPLVVLNQQIITGRILIPDHYHWYYHKPLVIIFILIILFEFIDKKSRNNFKKTGQLILVAIIVTINFYNAWIIQSSSYKNGEFLTAELNKRYGPVLDWLNDNAKKDEVVAGGKTISYLAPMYTPLNSVSAADGHYTLVADEEQMIERMFLEWRLRGLNTEDLINYRSNISGEIYGQQYRKQTGEYTDIPSKKFNWLVDQYGDFLEKPMEDILRKYQVRYIIWDTVAEPNAQVSQYSFLKELHRSKEIGIYYYENK